MKPELPLEIQDLLSVDLVRHIQRFVPHLSKKKSPPTSPSLQRELERLQRSPLRGVNEMYLRGFDDFILK
jgi:hypothetical protein